MYQKLNLSVIQKIFFISLFLSASLNIKAQTGGLSASKLATLCAGTVPAKTIEFEPAFAVFFSDKMWNKSRKLEPVFAQSDSIAINSAFGFRFTYGFFENFEAGISLPVNFESFSLGIKYKLPWKVKMFNLGLLAGVNMNLGNKRVYGKIKFVNQHLSFPLGIVLSYHNGKKFGFDTDVQYQFSANNKINDLFINADIGYYITENIQPVIGLNYVSNNFKENKLCSDLMIINPGITIENAKNFILVISFPYGILGKNVMKPNGISFALTVLIL